MEALQFFTSTRAREALQKTKYKENLKNLEISCSDTGLQPGQITQLIDVIGGKIFPEYVSRRLIRLLIPAEIVNVESVIRAISWICTRTLSLSVQIDLLKWIATFYDFIDNKNDFHALYGVIFSFLSSDVLCPVICCLLHLMTLEEDVLPNRVRYLISLQNRVGAHPYLTALLNIYHSYRPNMIVLKFKSQKQSINPFRSLTAPFQKLLEKTRSIQNKSVERRTSSVSYLRKDLVSNVFELPSYNMLEKILHQSELPGAVKLILGSPLRRLYLTSCKEHLLIQLGFWIRTSAYDEIMSCDILKVQELLQQVVDISDDLQEEFSNVSLFLRNSVALQNNSFSVSLRLSLLEYLPFCKIEETFRPIYEMFCCSSLEYKCSVIKCLTQLYLNWHLLEIPRYKWRLKQQQEINSSETEEILTTFRAESNVECQPDDAIMQLSKYVNKLITLALFMHPNCHPVILHYSFSFYNMVLDMCEQQQSRIITPPPKFLIYSALFSCNSYALARMCHLMTRYRKAITTMKKRLQIEHINYVISAINGYIVDTSDALWLCKLFSSQKASIFCMKDIPVTVINSNSSINDQFSLYHHPALVWLVQYFVCFTAGNGLELAVDLLSDLEMRNRFLQVLTERQLHDIVTFIHTFIRQNI